MYKRKNTIKPTTDLTKKDLLVTLTCIGFLLLTVAAVGPRGRRHAKDMLCLSNLSKWGTVFQAFLQDNNGKFMPGWSDGEPAQTTNYWMDALRPYYGNNHKLRCCPEAAVTGTEIGLSPWGGNGTFVAWGAFEGECGQPSSSWGRVTACDYGSYGMNAWAGDLPPDAMFSPFDINNWRTPNVAGAADIPLLSGSQWVDAWPHHSDTPPMYDGEPWGVSHYDSMLRLCINRHEGSINSAFLDFSARKVGLKELWILKWHRRYDTCGPYTLCGGAQPQDWPDWMQNFPDY
jgi:hypothetical protein